jgi:integrase
METEKMPGSGNLLLRSYSRDQNWRGATVDVSQAERANGGPSWLAPSSRRNETGMEGQLGLEKRDESPLDRCPPEEPLSMTLAEFVERRFAPEYVSVKRSAGRAHFQATLKHILTPEAVDKAFHVNTGKTNVRMKAIPGWPYMDSLRLCDVSAERVQLLIAAANEHGYSAQTAIHIRSVVRAIFSHAQMSNCFRGENPASLAVPPGMARKQTHTLTLSQLQQVMRLMRYPETEIALFAILTGMSVAEICGLQWKYVNLSDIRRLVDGEWIPAKTIAIRNQSYRGEFESVMKNRNRILSIPELLNSLLRTLRNRKKFTAPDDFVLASRSGTPISQNNVAARRLKSIGRSLELPWLSWHVFHRTYVALNSEFGRRSNNELKKVLPFEDPEL